MEYVTNTVNCYAGDADLYVSDTVKKPTYDNYEVKSTTCGEDLVDISELNRPVYIGGDLPLCQTQVS